jgi:hypothetical protein
MVSIDKLSHVEVWDTAKGLVPRRVKRFPLLYSRDKASHYDGLMVVGETSFGKVGSQHQGSISHRGVYL